jgi:hypothetical protein
MLPVPWAVKNNLIAAGVAVKKRWRHSFAESCCTFRGSRSEVRPRGMARSIREDYDNMPLAASYPPSPRTRGWGTPCVLLVNH